MSDARKFGKLDLGGVWDEVREALAKQGIELDLDRGRFSFGSGDNEGSRFKVVCVTPGVKESVDEMARNPRDQVVMVRVDESTSQDLDAWVRTGAVKSRSEAAALFIREGLRVRETELARLREALDEVEAAQGRLAEKAREVFGEG